MLLALGLAVTPACCHRPPAAPVPIANPQAAAHGLWQRYGQARDLVVELLVMVDPPAGEARTFTIRVNTSWDGRVRLTMTKMNVAFLDGLIGRDGVFTAILHQQQRVVTGHLRDIDQALDGAEGAAFFGQLRTFIEELRQGPLPVTTGYQTGIGEVPVDGGVQHLAWLEVPIDGDLTARVYLDPPGEQVVVKELRRGGTVRCRIEYRKEAVADDGLRRAHLLLLSIPQDPAGYVVKLKRLDAVPAITERELGLEVPFGWERMPITDFVRLLVE
jgi:hypothetical protein